MERIGFVGLGTMGRPMARNLMDAGYELTVYNRSPGKAGNLEARGATVAASPGEVAEGSDVVVTMLPGPPEIEEVVTGTDGVLERAAEGSLIVDMSTSSPALARGMARLARERGLGVLDAPVSGGDVGAAEGTLSIMAGGTERDFERVEPVLRVLGRTIVHVGESGAGQTVKACNQVVVALVIEAVSEALALGSGAGAAPEKILQVLSGGLAASQVIEVKGGKLLSHDFAPGGKVESHHKDLGIALAAGREYGVPMPVTAAVDQMFATLRAAGRGGWDHSALSALAGERAGQGLSGRENGLEAGGQPGAGP